MPMSAKDRTQTAMLALTLVASLAAAGGTWVALRDHNAGLEQSAAAARQHAEALKLQLDSLKMGSDGLRVESRAALLQIRLESWSVFLGRLDIYTRIFEGLPNVPGPGGHSPSQLRAQLAVENRFLAALSMGPRDEQLLERLPLVLTRMDDAAKIYNDRSGEFSNDRKRAVAAEAREAAHAWLTDASSAVNDQVRQAWHKGLHSVDLGAVTR